MEDRQQASAEPETANLSGNSNEAVESGEKPDETDAP